MFELGSPLAQSPAAKPDRCDYRSQRITVPQTLSSRCERDSRDPEQSTSSPPTAPYALWPKNSDCAAASNLVGQILGRKSAPKIQQQSNADIGANIASGSYPADAMVVIPCSMGTLARIANGIASHLIERAADVCLKERRPLVLCVRETPLNKIHIRNMYRAADAGATVFPLIPAFYFRPTTLDAMAREFAYRVLAHIGLPQPDAYRWKG